MQIHADRTPENRSHRASYPSLQKKSSSGSANPFTDNRTETVVQRKFQEMVNNRPEGKQVAQLSQIASNFTDSGSHPIQRSIKIGQDDAVENFTVDDILKKVFRKNLITNVDEANAIEEILNVYFDENKQFESVDEMLEAARKELNREDDEVENDEAPQLELSEIEEGKIDRALQHTSGEQLQVQAKMVEITRLVKGNLLDSETVKYASDVISNGLCGGWTTLFMKYPDWVEPVYNAVRSWKKPAKLSGPAALLHFENHLKQTTKFEGAEHVIKLLGDVYESMSVLEPEAGYDSLPDWTDTDVGELPASPTSDQKVTTDEITFNLRKKNAANLVSREIKSRTSKEAQGDCMVHIESDIHHMALRVQKLPAKGKSSKLRLLITVVETEKSGIVKTNNWGQAEQVLNSWLEEEEPDLKTITVRIKMSGF